MKVWRVTRYGPPHEVLALEDVDAPVPGHGELLIRVSSVTLNFNDLDGIYGRYRTVPVPVPYTPGMEVLGRVESAGAGAENWIGGRVVAIPTGAHGGYAELVTAPAAMAFEMPDDIPEPEAAGIFMPFHLAHLALYERARLRRGETLLVHAAAGGAGSAALQLGLHSGARVLATAGSEEKRALCRDLGADVVLDSRSPDVAAAVLDVTDGRGVDVAFDTIGGEVTTNTFRCMAFNGRHVIAGFASGIEHEDEGIVPRPVLFGNFDLVGVCHAYVDDPVAFKRDTTFNFPAHRDGVRVHGELLDLVRGGAIRSVIGKELPFAELPDGLVAMESRETIGRVVVRV
jgi:NADPH2:quinone reductase